MLNLHTWEIEIELAAEALACNGDVDSFRDDMSRLGFDPPEIDEFLERILS